MNRPIYPILLVLIAAFLTACDGGLSKSGTHELHGHHDQSHDEPEKGPHGGRMLTDGDFALELAIHEEGVPPEYRVWATKQGRPLKPGDVDLSIKLTRLGNRIDNIRFSQQDDFLRGDTEIYEPHSFVVEVVANHGGESHRWQYENFEGRTTISPKMAEAFGLQTLTAGPAEMRETITVYGRVTPNYERQRTISARFEGLIKAVYASLGDSVQKGQPLLKVESNESLKAYTIKAPISGVITQRDANPGEQSGGRKLFTVTDTRSVWVDLSVFPKDRSVVHPGAPVKVSLAGDEQTFSGSIDRINVLAGANQAVTARVVLDNSDGRLLPGSNVKAEITVGTYSVPLAVKRAGLQAFRDFTVVYAQVGDVYEVRMLELGRQDAQWVEVLGGLRPGTRYVSENSYLIKADIEKSGAAHDH